MIAVMSENLLQYRVLHGSGSGIIPRNFRGIRIIFSTNPAVTTVMGVCFVVILR